MAALCNSGSCGGVRASISCWQAALARKAQPRLEGGLPSGWREACLVAGGRAAKQAQHQEAPATRRSSPPRSPPFRVRKLISELRAGRAPRHRIISQVRKWRGRFAEGGEGGLQEGNDRGALVGKLHHSPLSVLSNNVIWLKDTGY